MFVPFDLFLDNLPPTTLTSPEVAPLLKPALLNKKHKDFYFSGSTTQTELFLVSDAMYVGMPTWWGEDASVHRFLETSAKTRRTLPDRPQKALLAGVLGGRSPARAQAVCSAADVRVLTGALNTLAVVAGSARHCRRRAVVLKDRGSTTRRWSTGVVAALVMNVCDSVSTELMRLRHTDTKSPMSGHPT